MRIKQVLKADFLFPLANKHRWYHSQAKSTTIKVSNEYLLPSKPWSSDRLVNQTRRRIEPASVQSARSIRTSQNQLLSLHRENYGATMNNQNESPVIIAQGSNDQIGWWDYPTRDMLMKKKPISCHDFYKCIHWSNTARVDALTQRDGRGGLTRMSMIKSEGSSHSSSQSVANEYPGK